jgi:hypothetical protein
MNGQHRSRNPKCRNCFRSMRLYLRNRGNPSYGARGNGYFCTLECALSFAVNYLRLADREERRTAP